MRAKGRSSRVDRQMKKVYGVDASKGTEMTAPMPRLTYLDNAPAVVDIMAEKVFCYSCIVDGSGWLG